ncbi:hypothetical protein C8R46DRAFT_1060861 [Mycena filopes]|nr:hypothetical protein C8R46DRAFT_1060861 [Mycena filopes]
MDYWITSFGESHHLATIPAGGPRFRVSPALRHYFQLRVVPAFPLLESFFFVRRARCSLRELPPGTCSLSPSFFFLSFFLCFLSFLLSSSRVT